MLKWTLVLNEQSLAALGVLQTESCYVTDNGSVLTTSSSSSSLMS